MSDDNLSEFDRAILSMQDFATLEPFRQAGIEVMDTAHLAHLWLRGQGLAYTGADVLGFTRLIVDRAEEIKLEMAEGDEG